jgi:hypothetical protein
MNWYFQTLSKFAFAGRMTLFVVLLISSVPVLAYAANREGGACAAFAADGTSAAATYDDKNLSLEITNAAGQTSHLSTALLHRLNEPPVLIGAFAPETCSIFFDGTGDLVAVGISPGPLAADSLQIAVADVRSSALVGHFDVRPQISLDSPAFWGFLENTNSLVITEQTDRGKSFSEGPLYGSFLFSPTGEKLSASAMTTWRIRVRTAWNSFYADARHNRLWILPCTAYSARLSNQPFCSISSTSLTTEHNPDSIAFNPGNRGLERLQVWMVPEAAAMPNANTILLAESVARVDTVWRVDMQEQTMQRSVVPHHAHFPNSDWTEAISLSPDGQLAAIAFDQNTGNFPWITEGAHWSGKHIAIVRVQPLASVTVFPSGGAQRISAFAVDHRQGKITLMVFLDKRWQRLNFSDHPSPN